MKTSIALLSLCIGFSALAADNDFSGTNNRGKPISADELRKSFLLEGDIFITDSNGRLLYQVGEHRGWEFSQTGKIESNWSFQEKNRKQIALTHKWRVENDGRIVGTIAQYESMARGNSREPVIGKLLREQNFELKDFAPVNWVIEDEKERVVVRFTPRLKQADEVVDIQDMEINLKNAAVFDNTGRLWTTTDEYPGKFIGLKTHAGLVALSFYPFKGGRVMGVAKGNDITLNKDDLQITIKNSVPLVASDDAVKVYALIDRSQKSDRIKQLHAISSSKETNFLERLSELRR
ncbi:MAG TPA: hypothetical protein VM432_09365 [Bdellovibrionales bacterium]|nr:hypothetical protein [Bdellovibrionales bacterium]